MAKLLANSTAGGKVIETVEGSQAKVDALSGIGNTATVKEASDQIGVLQGVIDEHKAIIATPATLGHVKANTDAEGNLIIPESSGLGGIPVDVTGINNGEGIVFDEDKAKFVPMSKLSPPKIYGVKIDTLNSNPATAVTYTDSAVGMTGGSANWDSVFPFNRIRPVLLNNGVVTTELNKNDFTKTNLNAVADTTSGNAGDVMIEFPKLFWKFDTVGSDLFVRYSERQVDSSWKCHAHTRGETEKNFAYIGAYLSFNSGGKLRSLSGKTPTATQTIGVFRTQAQANGLGYDQMGYYQLLMLQILFLVRYKSRDSQTALGRGYVDGNASAIATGNTNLKGMNFGETTGKQQMKFCGIEDFWGNLIYWVDGMFSNASRNILIGTQDFNNMGTGYINYGQGAPTNLNGFISGIQGGTETGFIVKASAGSATTYFADSGYLFASSLPYFGGDWSNADNAGAFNLRVLDSAVAVAANIGARLNAL